MGTSIYKCIPSLNFIPGFGTNGIPIDSHLCYTAVLGTHTDLGMSD